MKRKIITTLVLLCCVIVCYAITSGITGKWAGSVNISGTDYPLTYTLKADSGKVTGTAENPQGEAPITGGKITGDTFTFSVSVSGSDVPHTGKYYAAGDSIGMDIDYQGMKLHTTLKRSN